MFSKGLARYSKKWLAGVGMFLPVGVGRIADDFKKAKNRFFR